MREKEGDGRRGDKGGEGRERGMKEEGKREGGKREGVDLKILEGEEGSEKKRTELGGRMGVRESGREKEQRKGRDTHIIPASSTAWNVFNLLYNVFSPVVDSSVYSHCTARLSVHYEPVHTSRGFTTEEKIHTIIL